MPLFGPHVTRASSIALAIPKIKSAGRMSAASNRISAPMREPTGKILTSTPAKKAARTAVIGDRRIDSSHER